VGYRGVSVGYRWGIRWDVQYIILYVFVAVVRCAAWPPVLHALILGLEARSAGDGGYEAGSVVTYSCLGGRRLDDGSTTKHVACLHVGTWNDTLHLSCDCKYTNL